jgi:glutaminase-like protein
MKKSTTSRNIKLTALAYVIAIAGILAAVDGCNKSKHTTDSPPLTTSAEQGTTPTQEFVQGGPQTAVVTVVGIADIPGSTDKKAIFSPLEEPFTVSDAGMVTALTNALNQHTPVKLTFNPWTAKILAVNKASQSESAERSSRQVVGSAPGATQMVDLSMAKPDVINEAGIAAINTTTGGLTEVVPDMATAQAMFDYITHQCCALPGPYTIDQCISFQYCIDGCYARAHKMCFILNNKFNYATHKVFSFAWPMGSYSLSVKGEKWGGCCINWWYHVAPLVNIKTPSGTKAYVFDPSMFDQPVLLATWLHAQENPACSGSAKVTSFNIQPTSSYSPSDTSHFDTDPTYSSTNSTMAGYAPLKTCP